MKTLFTTVIVVFALGSMKAQTDSVTHDAPRDSTSWKKFQSEIETRYTPSQHKRDPFSHEWEIGAGLYWFLHPHIGIQSHVKFEHAWKTGETHRFFIATAGPVFKPNTNLTEFALGIGIGAGFSSHLPVPDHNGGGHPEEKFPKLRARGFLNFGNHWKHKGDDRAFLIESSVEYRGGKEYWYSLHPRYSPDDGISAGFILEKHMGIGFTIGYGKQSSWGAMSGWISPFLFDFENRTWAFAFALKVELPGNEH